MNYLSSLTRVYSQKHKLSLCIIIIYSCLGLLSNYLISFASLHANHGLLTIVYSFNIVLYIGTSLILFYGVKSKRYQLNDYGFAFSKGFLISVILCALVTLYFILRGNSFPQTLDYKLPILVLLSSLEEILFRALLIGCICAIMHKRKWSVVVAIILSSLVFVLPHIPIKTLWELVGIFNSSIILGAIYYKSRSVIIPIFVHVLFNTFDTYGVWGASIVLIITSIIVLWGKLGRNIQGKV